MFTILRMLLTEISFGRYLRYVPGLYWLYRRYVWRRIHNGFFGVYRTHAEAAAAAPSGWSKSWDDDKIAELAAGGPSLLEREQDTAVIDRFLFQPSTFASLFWIERLLRPGGRLVDFGGGGGLTYDYYRRYGALPEGAHWRVVETPAMAARGAARVAREGLSDLSFSRELEEIDACDLFLTAGCIQYVDPVGAAFLDRLPVRPQFVLINKLPMTDGDEFWTLQNIGGRSAAPYRVYNRRRFIEDIESKGYRLADRWVVAELKTNIPFYPQKLIPTKDGFLFERV